MASAPTPEEEHSLAVGLIKSLQTRVVADVDGRVWHQWLEFMAKNGGGSSGSSSRIPRDPAKQSLATLNAFLAALPAQEAAAVERSRRRCRLSRLALADLQQVLGQKSWRRSKALLKLIKLTLSHPSFAKTYGELGDASSSGWVSGPKQREVSSEARRIEDLLLAMDCEMVATAEDESALARICVCNAKGELLMDRLVRPDAAPTDLRSWVTGFRPGELEAVSFTRADAQAELLQLLTPFTILVGHTLHKDLAAIRLDVPLVVDINMLYRIAGSPNQTPGLAWLVEHVLGRTDFREGGASSVHSCAEDTIGTMQVFLHRLRSTELQDEVPDVVWIPAPPPRLKRRRPEEEENRVRNDDPNQQEVAKRRKEEEAMSALFIHRLPAGGKAFAAAVALFADLGEGQPFLELRSAQLMPAASESGHRSFQHANVVFKSPGAAEIAFARLPAFSAGVDRNGRRQKQVELRLPSSSVRIFVLAPAEGEPPSQLEAEGSKTTWSGWQEALDSELRAAGGAMPWQRLEEALIERHRDFVAGEDESIGQLALASIPEAYLSKEDEMVRLPARACF